MVVEEVVPGVKDGHLPPSDGGTDVLDEAGPGAVDTPLHHLHRSVVRAAQRSSQVDLGHGERHQGLEGHAPPLRVGVGQLQEVRPVEVLPDVQRLSVDTDVGVLNISCESDCIIPLSLYNKPSGNIPAVSTSRPPRCPRH